MDPEVRGRVKRFHQNVLLAGAFVLILGSLVAAFLIVSGQQGIPSWLDSLARAFSRKR